MSYFGPGADKVLFLFTPPRCVAEWPATTGLFMYKKKKKHLETVLFSLLSCLGCWCLYFTMFKNTTDRFYSVRPTHNHTDERRARKRRQPDAETDIEVDRQTYRQTASQQDR